MKNIKSKIFIILFGAVIIVCLTFIITLNLSVNSYIENQAKQAISQELFYYSDDAYSGDYDAPDYVQSIFSVSTLVLDSTLSFWPESEDYEEDQWNENDSQDYDYYYYSKDDRDVQKYIKDHGISFDKQQIFSAKIDGNLYYMGTASLQWDNQEYYDSNGKEVQNFVLYINTSSVYKVIEKLNYIFFIVLFLSVSGTVFAGIKAGAIIENSEKKLKKFFANASHELKTPLMSIQGYAEGLREGVITDPELATQIILNQSDKMAGLIDELLFLSKIESGEFKMKKDIINLNELVECCVLSIAPLADKKSIELNVIYSEKPLLVLGDEAQLHKALSNILSNAVRYAKSKIEVSVHSSKAFANISIDDNGSGISDEDFPYLFERFYKGRNGNTGIGLSVVKEIMMLHKGLILVENTDSGARFTLQFKQCKNK